MKYEFHPEAELDLQQTVFHYELHVPGLGRRFATELERVIQLLIKHPELGARIDADLRHFILRRFPFSVVYSVDVQCIYIVAVAHSSRKPNYWQLRVQEP